MPTPPHHQPQALPTPPATGSDADWALFLDVDGTLLDFAGRPDAVQVGPQLRRDLASMRRRLSDALAIVSGRPLAELDALLDWHEHAAAGLHGAELRLPDGTEHITGNSTGFARVRATASKLVAEASGVLLEDKRHALALHFRHAPAAREHAQQIAQTLLQQAGSAFVLQNGNHVIELKPAGVDKGRALDELMTTQPFRARRPWMLGDDLTDEDAFERVNACGGVSVIVGARRPTCARYALPDPAAVRGWLHGLASDTNPNASD